jgi:ferric enterobactin receptor
MRNGFLTILLLCIVTVALAQQNAKKNTEGITIQGKVTDSVSGKIIEYATISLYKGNDKKPVDGTVTSTAGLYKLTVADTGIYKVVVEFIGYNPRIIHTVNVNKKNPLVNLPDIALTKSAVTLQSVVVTSSAGLIENKIDKLIFNAEKDITSQTGVATDILKKVPQVSVDVDGNVELAGSASVRFLVNGKPSTAFGSNIAEVLQSIPASQIKSIEVITNPGAKYDAQGIGGIINIILKQSKVKGINGNVSLTAGTLNENGSFNLNVRKGDLGLNAFVSGNTRLATDVFNTSERLTVDTAGKKNLSLTQLSSSNFKRHGLESGAGFDYTYKKKNSFTGSFRYGNFGNSGMGYTNQSQVITNQAGNIISGIASVNNSGSTSKFYNTDVELGYKRTFKEDQELEISFNSSYENNKGITKNYQLLQPQDSTIYGVSTANPGVQKEKEFQVDYTQPVKEDISLGFGGKIGNSEVISNSDIFGYKPMSKSYQYDSSLSNNLDYKQYVYALYGEISFPIGKLFNTKIGGRYERTEINSFYSNAQQQAGRHGYNTFVPSIFFSKSVGDNQTVKLSYSKRIERPDYGDLNPFINTTDPKNVSAGNPYLLPEIGHRVEFSYSRSFEKTGNFMITAFYRNNQNDIQPFISFYPSLKVGDSVYTNVAVSMRQNIGTENNMGINGFVDLHPNSKMGVRSNVSFFKRHTINAINPGYNSNSFNYRINLNVSYQFGKTLAGEFFGNFNSARNEAQGKYPSFTSYSFAIRQQFLNKKASLALTVINPFNKYVNQRTQLFGPNFTVNSVRKIPFRSIGINFTWKFGRLEFKKERDENKDPNPGIPEGT